MRGRDRREVGRKGEKGRGEEGDEKSKKRKEGRKEIGEQWPASGLTSNHSWLHSLYPLYFQHLFTGGRGTQHSTHMAEGQLARVSPFLPTCEYWSWRQDFTYQTILTAYCKTILTISFLYLALKKLKVFKSSWQTVTRKHGSAYFRRVYTDMNIIYNFSEIWGMKTEDRKDQVHGNAFTSEDKWEMKGSRSR